jgi:hypothetical protein
VERSGEEGIFTPPTGRPISLNKQVDERRSGFFPSLIAGSLLIRRRANDVD